MKPYRRSRVPAVLAGAVVLLCLGRTGSAIAEDGAPHVKVDYHQPRLSVEARGLTLAQLLGEIGVKVGFTVVDNGSSPTPLTVSIHDASTEEVLRQLLRGENHAVLYQEGSGVAPSSAPGIDTIVLLGEVGRPKGTVEPRDRRQTGSRPEGAAVAASSGPSPSTAPLPRTPESTPLMSWDRDSTPDSATDPQSPPITVGNILRTHAMAAAGRAAQETTDSSPPAAAPTQVSLEAALAETTRRAQQDLAALIDGLAAATRSLNESMAVGQK